MAVWKTRESGKSPIAVEDLEASQSDIAALKSQNEASSWSETIKWKGDFRYRYEDIDDKSKDSDRQRHRIRAAPSRR